MHAREGLDLDGGGAVGAKVGLCAEEAYHVLKEAHLEVTYVTKNDSCNVRSSSRPP